MCRSGSNSLEPSRAIRRLCRLRLYSRRSFSGIPSYFAENEHKYSSEVQHHHCGRAESPELSDTTPWHSATSCVPPDENGSQGAFEIRRLPAAREQCPNNKLGDTRWAGFQQYATLLWR